jgi:hypothetical protein
MFDIYSDLDGRALPFSLCYVLCLCATWIQFAHAGPQTGMQMTSVSRLSGEPQTDIGAQLRMVMHQNYLVVWD